MTKKKMPILRPKEVQAVYPVTSMVRGKQRLDGCKFAVVYEGVADVNKRTLSRMGLFSGGYGSGHQNLETEEKLGGPHITTFEYVFKEGILYPEPFARANKFHDALQSAITDFVPVFVSKGLGTNRDSDERVHQYTLIVAYPDKAKENPLFNTFIRQGKPNVIKVYNSDNQVNVMYGFNVNSNVSPEQAYSKGQIFKTYMMGQMTQRQDENIK